MIKSSGKYLALLIIALLLCLLIFFSTTTAGLKWMIAVATRFTPGSLHVQLVSGALNRTIVLNNIIYKNNNIIISLPKLSVKIQPLALFLNEIRIDHLLIDKLTITRLGSAKRLTNKATPPHFFLPLKLNLQNVAIKNLVFQQGKKTNTLQQIHFNTLIKSNAIIINALTIREKSILYTLQGKVALAPINAKLQFNKKIAGITTIAAKINATGDWKKLTINSQLTTPTILNASITINNLLNTPTWQLTGRLEKFDARKYSKTFNYSHITGIFSGNGNAKVANLSMRLAPNKTTPKSYLTLHINGKISSQASFKGMLAWHNLILSNIYPHNLTSPQGQLTLAGNLKNYKLSSNIQLSGYQFPSSTLYAQAIGNLNGLKFHKIIINTLNGSITGQATLNWQAKLHYRLALRAQHLNPQQTWTDWYGDVSFDNRIEGSASAFKFTINKLAGHLRRQRLSGAAQLQIEHRTTTADVKLIMGAAKINANIQWQRYLHATWNINIPNLSDTVPFSNGTLVTAGDLMTTNSLPNISATLSAKGLAWLNEKIDTLNANVKLDPSTAANSTVAITASQLQLLKHKFTNIQLNATGNALRHRIILQATMAKETLQLQATGRYMNKRWNLMVPRFTLTKPNTTSWALRSPFTVAIGKHDLQLSNFNWHAGTQSMQASFRWQDKTLQQIQISLHQVALPIFNLFLPDKIKLQGELNLQANYSNKSPTTAGKLMARLTNVKVYYPLQNQEHTLSISTGVLKASLVMKKLITMIHLKLANRDAINATLSVSPFNLNDGFNDKQQFSGNLQAHLNDLGFLPLFFPQLSEFSGQLKTNLQWNGTLKTPHLKGGITLNNAAAILPQQGLHIKNIALDATAANDQVDYNVRATSGKGTLNITGKTFLNSEYKTALQLSGMDITAINTPQYQITVSPHLTVTVLKHRINLSGELDFPSAAINLKNYTNITTLSSDIVITDKEQANITNSAWNNIYAKIKLNLGKNVHFENNYLDAQLSGSLNLSDNTHDNTKATGELTIDKGTFTAFGQVLNIENGKLIYLGGPTTNPGLNIKATKTITTFVNPTQNSLTQTTAAKTNETPINNLNIPLQQEILIVGVSVTNTLNDPNIILFSNQPGLSQADILSYLVLGYPLDNAGNQQAQALLRAANAISANNKNAGDIITQLKDMFSLDQVSLQSDNYLNPETNTVEQNTSLVLGKMLSPKLFVRYSIGLLEPVNTLSTAYHFNKHWFLQTETNSLGNGVDIVYSLEAN